MGRTNIVLDEPLVDEAILLSGAKSKREVVDIALREYVAKRKRKNLFDLAGSDCISETYDYKAAREDRAW